jgi:uncharacterized cupredoxin-like copper-binding protein
MDLIIRIDVSGPVVAAWLTDSACPSGGRHGRCSMPARPRARARISSELRSSRLGYRPFEVFLDCTGVAHARGRAGGLKFHGGAPISPSGLRRRAESATVRIKETRLPETQERPGDTSMKKLTLIPLATLVLAAAVGGAQAAVDYIENASEIVKATDWKQMKTITVSMSEFNYEPEVLRFKAGQPYKLELKNGGEKKHYFTAPGFFKAIATRKVQSNADGEVKAPYFLALEMMADGGQLDLYFVPVTKGEYPVYCTIDDHKDEGMHGTIVIE